MRHKTSVAIFQSDLGMGGIQKSLINLLNNIDYSAYDIDLYLVNDKNFFEKKLPRNVTVKKLKPLPSLAKILPFQLVRLLYGKSYYSDKEYDVSIDFNSYQHVTALGALSASARRYIGWVHSDLEKRRQADWRYRILWLLQRNKYKYFNKLAVVSSGILRPTCRLTKISCDDISVIGNYVDADNIIKLSAAEVNFFVNQKNYNLVSVGRLIALKGVDVSIKIIAEVVKQRKDIHLYIIGDGPERPSLEALTKKLNLNEFITFLGSKPNPYAYMNKMDGFISTSHYEGQGINILEAKVLGLEVFIPKHLEAYTYEVQGSTNLVESIVEAEKDTGVNDNLSVYNYTVLSNFYDLINLS